MSTVVKLEALLTTIATEHNTAVLAQASTELSTHWLKQPDTIPRLLQIVANSSFIGARQLAAVEARKLVEKSDGKAWLALSEQVRQEIKTGILSVAVNQESILVRNALARVISEIAKIEISNHRWIELITILNSLCASPVVGQREVGVYVLYTLFEVITDQLSDYIPELLALFCKSVNDPESITVAVTTVQALGKVAEFIEDPNEPSFKTFCDLIPSIVQVMQRTLVAGDDANTLKVFEVFEGLLLLEVPLVTKYFGELVNFYLVIASTPDNSDEIRIMAMSFLMLTASYAKTRLTKLRLVPTIIDAIFPIAAEEESKDREDRYPAKSAIQVINSLALAFPPHHVYPAVMRHVATFIQDSQRSGFRRAAMLAIAVLVEGCADHMREKIDQILPSVIYALQDHTPCVRRAACTALGALSVDLDDEIAEQHSVLLPLLLTLVDDPDVEVQPVVLGTLVLLVEALDDAILPYLELLITKLIGLISSSNRKSVLASVNCIGSVARSSGSSFLPYFKVTMAQLCSFMMITEPSNLDMRAIATDAMGAVAEAVGKEAFAPHMSEMMNLVISGISIDSYQLRECSYLFFGVLARTFGEDFSPYLQLVVPSIMHSCNQQDTDWNDMLKSSNSFDPAHNPNGEEDIDISEESDNEESAIEKYSFNSAISLEKASSFQALSLLFTATRAAFLPFVSDSANAALSSLDNFNDDVRISAAQCLLQFFVAMQSIADSSEWQAGLPCQTPVHENVASIGKIAMEGVLKMLDEEEARMVVAQTLQEIVETIKLIGPVSVGFDYSSTPDSLQYVNALANMLLQLFRGEHSCQINEDFDESAGHDDDELAELDALVISTAADALGGLAAALGPEYGSYFSPFFPLIAKHYQKSKPVSDRSMAIGTLAEIVDGLEHGVSPFTQDLLPLFIKSLRDEDDEVRSNGAFGIGLLIYYSTTDLSSYYPQLLQLLYPFFTIDSKSNMSDNACGAVARMILRCSQAVPLDQVIPVFFGALPLKRDFEENPIVFKCIFFLLEAKAPSVLSELEHIRQLCKHVLAATAPSQVDSPTRMRILEVMSSIQ
ncbi:hypothetical protein BATDEDRAFT_86921 [Batrachochytrium dendrobatidis JAM81]|uniref:Importin N-terminal domain-containing protein n=2 Tax=Batrachochytrium dendrobatidis TaxID=109871 RepID=F4NXL6_BATDJ|nr:uncharacterized protein BATDEDRAFT_86921 [Batrachochytrium dendrobatidis JAM81]EGF82165.1 hypothetical protein BATDEDRAFT_86921 [Batrachochytrium dendrobatidis JAM81]KAK5670835.1 hypothetical protein QVD99_002604 [Batrachochytrium dendrobatidis]OAJ40488.1 hypothetical protein BDEG_24216 [Batrachochytrium dendrobatidis JEL423]|eukprot:XP_006677657.1 hypothetical protein BATDEDRAFT_86921 [Batrachochytrium dendrobatidis JAM81]